MHGIEICAIGSYVPDFVATNEMYAEFLDTSDEWIQTRTGIKSRHISVDKPNYYMAAESAKDALKNGNIDPLDIDMIIVSTCTAEFLCPNTACLVQHEIGAVNASAIDINSACPGFIAALESARSYLATGDYKTILIVASEKLSNFVDYTDRSVCVLFGDGAGAVVVKGSQEKMYSSYFRAEGDMFTQLYIKTNYESNCPFHIEDKSLDHILDTDAKKKYMQMDGKGVYKFAVDAMPKAVEEVCKKSGFNMDDIDLVIPHQANIRIIKSALKKMNVPDEKVYISIQTHGNTSSACMPTCLAELYAQGRLKRGMKICLVGFGGGLNYGAIIFEY